MSVEFILADEDAAKIISELRREIWSTTYRGTYSDERIDNYDFEEHRQRDLPRISDSQRRRADRLFLFFDRGNGLYSVPLRAAGISAAGYRQAGVCAAERVLRYARD